MHDLPQTSFRAKFYRNILPTNKIHHVELLDGCLIGLVGVLSKRVPVTSKIVPALPNWVRSTGALCRPSAGAGTVFRHPLRKVSKRSFSSRTHSLGPRVAHWSAVAASYPFRKSCASAPWERRALARLQKPRWSVALPGKSLELAMYF